MDKMPAQMQAKAGQVDMDKAERDIRRKEGIICSMTPLERRKPDLIKATRKRRIAAGAGVQVQEVNRLLNEFEQMQGMMKKMKGGGLMKMMKRMGAARAAPKLPFWPRCAAPGRPFSEPPFSPERGRGRWINSAHEHRRLLRGHLPLRRAAPRHPRPSRTRLRGAPHLEIVADKLREWGIEVHTGIAGTGVVGVLRCGTASAPSACAPTSTRCRCRKRTTSRTARSTTAACMPAATTATPPCCWPRPGTWRRRATSAAR
jgi:hypothetical protein